VDVRNHGLSHQTSDRFDIGDIADDVAAVLDALEIPRAVVAGYSMGGTVVQALTHRHPRLVERMVLVATFTSHPPAWRRARGIGVWLLRTWERVTGIGTSEARAAYLLLTGAVPMRHARWLWGETNRRDIEGGYQSNFALLRFDSRDWVGRLGTPALVVIPGRDQLVPASWQYGLAAALPAARVLELPDARHEAPMTHPDPIAAAILEFVEASP
jgi:3-oxoadipate enol-lactonase